MGKSHPSPNNECNCGSVHAQCSNKSREVDEDGNVTIYCCCGNVIDRR